MSVPCLQVCYSCDSTCLTCNGSGPDQCVTCLPPLVFNLKSWTCHHCCSDNRIDGCCSCDHSLGSTALNWITYLVNYISAKRYCWSIVQHISLSFNTCRNWFCFEHSIDFGSINAYITICVIHVIGFISWYLHLFVTFTQVHHLCLVLWHTLPFMTSTPFLTFRFISWHSVHFMTYAHYQKQFMAAQGKQQMVYCPGRWIK